MTKEIEFEITKDEELKKDESLFVAGYFTKGENKGKKVAIQVRNTLALNPVEPIFEAFPDVECLIVTKDEKKAKKYFKKLIS